MALATPSITVDDGALLLADPTEGVKLRVGIGATNDPSVERVSASSFHFPVETAVRIETSTLRIPKLVNVVVMDTDGVAQAEAVHREDLTVDDGQHLVQIISLGVKCYLRVDGPITSTVEDHARLLQFPSGSVDIGIRSLHTQPQAKVYAGACARDLMRALSCFGSALKSRTPERSWPSLRGCPPLVEIHDGGFDAPAGLERTNTPVHLELPPNLEYLYPATSLAYYLDAQVVPGERPLLVADGVEHDLDGPEGYETTVQRTLEQVFFFDCVTRTEGLYPMDLHERSSIDDRVDFAFGDLYDRSLAEQVNTYLSVPWGTVEDLRPGWKLTADVAGDLSHAAFLPFAAYDLAHIRVPTPTERVVERNQDVNETVGDFVRADIGPVQSFQGKGADQPTIHTADPVETTEHAWVGDGVPTGASKPTAEACLRELAPVGEGPPRVQVIANAPEMIDERSVANLYGDEDSAAPLYDLRELIEMDVSIHEELTIDETRHLLTQDHDLLHYVGHVTEEGLQCADGFLDLRTLDSVGMRVFILNACRSYQQGTALVDAGAVGGVATLTTVANQPATKIGRQVARLLNSGFSLAAALDVVAKNTTTGRQYVILGDGNASIANTASGSALSFELDQRGGAYELSFFGYPTRQWPLGATFTPFITDNSTSYLSSGHITTESITRDELVDFLKITERFPFTVDDSLTWTDAVLERIRDGS